MARRPIQRKQANRMRKAMARRDLPAYIDLVRWLKDRRYADSTGQAEEIILAGRVRSESHKLGIDKGKQIKPEARIAQVLGRPLTDDDYEEVDVVARHVSAKFRKTLTVTPA